MRQLLLKQIAPSMTRTAVLRDAAITAGIGQFNESTRLQDFLLPLITA